MSPTPLGNRDLIRALNRSIILNTIKTRGPIGRAEVARLTGLSPATVTGITAELIDDDLIFEKQPGDSSGGRRPILLAINPRGAFVAGIKLMEDHAIGALTDLEATVIAKQTAPLPSKDEASAVATLAGLVETLLIQAGISPRKLIGLGVGLAGYVNSDNGVLRRSPFFGWRDVPLRELLQERIHCPVYIDNDVNTLTLADRWFGSGQGVENFITLTVGRGIGLGIVANGQLYRGAGGGAGEFGHTVVDPQGPLCECGKHGCLETFVGDLGLMRDAKAAYLCGDLPEISSVDDLLQLAENGNEAARTIFARAGTYLGMAAANLINLFNPARILVSGEGIRYGRWMFDPMRAALDLHALPDLRSDAEILFEPWGDDVWARGAASLVLRELFESPVNRENGLELA